jgi:hypothetical protein
MPLWFVLLAIGLGLYGLSLLLRDVQKVPPMTSHWRSRQSLSEQEQERIIFEAIKPGPRSR